MRYIIILTLSFSTFCVSAQISFQYDQSILVSVDGDVLSMPWTGGVNSTQYNTSDLNADGVEDLVLFDRTSNKVSTYLAKNDEYVYAPDYETYFPERMTNWMIMRDYDCDGKKDIFTSSSFGMTLYRNVSNGAELAWEVAIDPVTTKGTGSIINLKVNGTDIPAIEDVDGDGDLDIIAFGFNGGGLQLHQNFSIERTGKCDIPDFERITTSWGNFEECGCGTFAFSGQSCRPRGGRQLHVGGKSLMAYDMDNDGDMEIVIGEEDCNELYLLENAGDALNAVFESAVVFPNSTNPASFTSFPAAYLEDINFDGKKELLVSPNRSSNLLLGSTDFQNSSWIYENNGNDNTPVFQFSAKNFLQNKMLDHGNNASVGFADEDGDGDLDMLVTSHGQFDQSSEYQSQITLYRNIGTIVSPKFKLTDEDYLGLSTSQLGEMKLQIADINADGNQDLVITATSLNSFSHNIFYLPNTSSNMLDFTGVQAQSITTPQPVFSYENPYFFDINQDGLVDMLIGRSNGSLSYFKNTGTSAAPSFELETDSFYGIDLSFTELQLALAIGDIDRDGNVDLITTASSGKLTIYENFLNQLEEPGEGENAIYFNTLTEENTASRLGVKTLPVVANLINSGMPLIVLGTAQGGLQVLKNTMVISAIEQGGLASNSNELLIVYPNPGTATSNNGFIEIASKEAMSIRIVSVSGKEFFSWLSITANESLKISIDTLPNGMYLVIGERDGKIVDQTKFIVAD